MTAPSRTGGLAPEARPAGRRPLGPTATLAVLAAAHLAAVAAGAVALSAFQHPLVMGAMLCGAPIYALAALHVLRHGPVSSARTPLLLIVGTAIAARAILLPLPPVSTDIFRYVWDGRVQANGINPYRYIPADPALAGLRDPLIFPHINRADTAPTIYPPAAQMLFWAATRIGETLPVMKAALVGFELLTALALLGLMRRRGIPPARLLLYLWHPLPLYEVAGSGHVDVAATGLMMAAVLAADRGRQGLSGALLALGAGVKYFPAFVAPALYARWGWRMPAAFAAVLVLVYLPYLGAGTGVLGYLPGYAQEEGIAAGNGLFWLGALGRLVALPPASALVYLGLAGTGLLASGIAVALRRRPDLVRPEAAQGLLLGFLVAVTPHYPWYVMCLVPFLALAPTLSVTYLTLTAPMLYGMIWPYEFWTSQAVMFVPFAVLAAVDVARWRVGRAREDR